MGVRTASGDGQELRLKSRAIHIQAHYRSVWNATARRCEFAAGPINELPAGFVVLKFPPRRDRVMWTYATCCMTAAGHSKSIELHIFAPDEDDTIVELLVAVAHYHRTGATLDLGHTINFGRPWTGTSAADHGLISLPYLDGPKLEHLREAASTIDFYWLIPVTKAEVEYKKARGLEALETLFDKRELDYVNPARPSLV